MKIVKYEYEKYNIRYPIPIDSMHILSRSYHDTSYYVYLHRHERDQLIILRVNYKCIITSQWIIHLDEKITEMDTNTLRKIEDLWTGFVDKMECCERI